MYILNYDNTKLINITNAMSLKVEEMTDTRGWCLLVYTGNTRQEYYFIKHYDNREQAKAALLSIVEQMNKNKTKVLYAPD